MAQGFVAQQLGEFAFLMDTRQATGIRRLLGVNKLAAAALVYLIIVYSAAILAPVLVSTPPEEIDLSQMLTLPSSKHLLGTDENGRDVLSRLIYGSRVSLTVGVAVVAISATIGTVLGSLSGYFGRGADLLIMRLTDGMMSIPLFFLLLVALSSFGPTLPNIVAAIGLTSWMPIARIVRSEVIRHRTLDFVVAARSVGVPETRILRRHVLPHAVPSIIVACTLGVAYAILMETALSYLGLGIQPPMPSWGNMLSASQYYAFNAPQLAIYPGILIFLTVLSFNLLGDHLHDVLDPLLRRG